MKKLIFDTSAINALEADSDSLAITRSLGVGYRVGITETALAEVVAHPEEGKRKALFGLFKRLLNNGSCIMPFNWIIEKQAKAYQLDPTNYDWNGINVRFAAGEQEIAREEISHSLSDETRASFREWEKQFRDIFRDARPAFQAIFDDPSKVRPTLRAVTERLLGDGGAHLTIAANLVERATGNRPDETSAKDFIERCPPFKALLVALCFAQYDRCIRGEREESLGKAGRSDMFSAVYLPYCRIFITNDDGQYKALSAVVGLMESDVTVVMYDKFKEGLFGVTISA